MYHFKRCASLEGAWATAKAVYQGEHDLKIVEDILAKVVTSTQVDEDTLDGLDLEPTPGIATAPTPGIVRAPIENLQIVPYQETGAETLMAMSSAAPRFSFWEVIAVSGDVLACMLNIFVHFPRCVGTMESTQHMVFWGAFCNKNVNPLLCVFPGEDTICGALLVHFWVESAPKVHQKCTKNAPKVHPCVPMKVHLGG